MNIEEMQNWVKENFGEDADRLGLDFGLAMLLGQAGKLSDMIIHKNKDATEKKIAHVLFVLVNIANVLDINMEKVFNEHIMQKDIAVLFEKLEDYYKK